mmetsp:Transcript_23967/g.61791  ORF Transcript_23967/g.61791 Transcript_23967/m.61791 type:complete len:341 (-) Transcript_23967:689-1711(-)
MASNPVAIPAGMNGHSPGYPPEMRGSPSEHSDDVMARSCPIPIPHNSGSQGGAASSIGKGDSESARHQRLARKAESARAARLRHKQYVNEMHEQMMVVNSRVRELEGQLAAGEEAAASRVLASIKAALSPAQAETLGAWLKAASPNPVTGDLAAAFERCRIEDALAPAPGPATLGGALGRLSRSLPGSVEVSAGAGPFGSPSAATPAAQHSTSAAGGLTAGGPLRTGATAAAAANGTGLGGANNSAPISIRQPVHVSGGADTHPGSLPMESDDDGPRSLSGAFGGAGGGGLGIPSGAAASTARSWDDYESAHAILSLTSSASPPAHANSYQLPSMDLQFQ